jgi:hypothetical protein
MMMLRMNFWVLPAPYPPIPNSASYKITTLRQKYCFHASFIHRN